MSHPNARPIREADFQNNVAHLARMLGWRVAHFSHAQTSKGYRTPVRYDGKGFPDLVLVKRGREVLFVELKSAKGKVSPTQQEWLDTLKEADPPPAVYVWRPADIETVIPTVLAGKRISRGDVF